MTKCPNCGKVLPEKGFEFGEKVKLLCIECSCGARVYVEKPKSSRIKE